MRITLLRPTLRVQTTSGKKLGRVVDVILDTEAHTVNHYIVKGLFGPRLDIAPAQVQSFAPGLMIVDDAVSFTGKADSNVSSSASAAEPVVMREE